MQPVLTAPAEGVLAPREGGVVEQVSDRERLRGHPLVAAWLLSKRSPNTREAYLTDLLGFIEWAAANGLPDIFALRRPHLDAYAEHLRTGEHETRYRGSRSYSETTQARKLTAVSSFYAYCVEEAPDIARANPLRRVVRPETTDDTTTGSLTLVEARALLDAARAAGVRAHALVGLLLTTGMRISELVKVDTGDLGTEDGVRIVWVQRKGGRKAKLVVPQEVAQAVDRYRRGRRGPLFVSSTGERIRRQQVDRILRGLAKSAGYVDETGRPRTLTPHMLRHTAATLALDAGRDLVDVQEMLGHRDPKTTRRYIANRDKLQRSAVHTVAALLGADKDLPEEFA
jgi:integrase/recombinase XerD